MDAIVLGGQLESALQNETGQQTFENQLSNADVDRFQQCLNSCDSDSGQTVVSLGEAKVNAESNLGDKVLEGLQNVRTGYDDQVERLEASFMTNEPLGMSQVMQLQLNLAKLTLQGDLINKTVTKSTQNIDTLLKSQ